MKFESIIQNLSKRYSHHYLLTFYVVSMMVPIYSYWQFDLMTSERFRLGVYVVIIQTALLLFFRKQPTTKESADQYNLLLPTVLYMILLNGFLNISILYSILLSTPLLFSIFLALTYMHKCHKKEEITIEKSSNDSFL